MRIFVTKSMKSWYALKFYYIFTKTYKLEQEHVVNGIYKVADKVIKEKFFNSIPAETSSSNRTQYLVDQLFKHSDKLDNEEIRDEIITMIISVRTSLFGD